MNTYSPDIYNYILKEYEVSGYKLFYDMFGVLDNNEPLKIFEGDYHPLFYDLQSYVITK